MKKINLKKCFASLLASCMAAMLITVPSSAESSIQVMQPAYKVGGETVPIPQAGELTTTVAVKGTGKAQLICALYSKETGRLIDIESSELAELTGGMKNLTATMMVPSVKTNTFKCFVWDTDKLVPFDVPEDDKLYLTAEKIGNRVNLAWYACDGILTGEFEIYRDGELVAAVTDKGGYIHEIVDDGEYHEYEVMSTDGQRTSDTVTVEPGMSFDEAAALADSSFAGGEIWRAGNGGSQWSVPGGFAAGGWTYAQLVNNIHKTYTNGVIYVKVNASASFGYTYKKLDGTTYSQVKKNYAIVPAAGETAVYRIDAPNLVTDRTLNVMDGDTAKGAFMSLCGCGSTISVYGIWVFDGANVTDEIDAAMLGKTRNADALYPDGVSLSFSGGEQVSSGISYNAQNGDGTVVITDDYMEISKYTSYPRKPRFTIDDNYIYGSADKYVQLEIEYATNLGTIVENEANKNLFIDYVNTEGVQKRVYGSLESDGQKHTCTVILEDANIANNEENKFDFVLSRMSGDLDNEYLYIYSIKAKNLSHKSLQPYT